MKFKYLLNFFSALLLATVATGQQPSELQSAAAQLRRSHPDVNWDIRTAVGGNITCDKTRHVVMLGFAPEKIWVGIATASDSKQKPVTFTFELGKATQNSFCAAPKRIEVTPLGCDTGNGILPGCTRIKGCQAFAVPDDDCDPINFYWDSSQKRLRWWRN